MSEEALLAERTQQTFHENDLAEQREEARRRQEWEQVETSALGGLRKMPADKLRSRIGESTIGGVSPCEGNMSWTSTDGSPKRQHPLPSRPDRLVLSQNR
jgi:hypothetical protein